MYNSVTFTIEEVAEFKKRTEEKNKRLAYNNFDKEFDTRWVGMAAEEGLKELLEHWKIPYTHHADDQRIDDRDFSVGTAEIDVKCVATSYLPQPHYACDISAKQWAKMMKEGNPINTLLFTRYILHLNEVYFLGVISKERLKETAKFYPAGTPRGKIILNTDNWEFPISELTPIDRFFNT